MGCPPVCAIKKAPAGSGDAGATNEVKPMGESNRTKYSSPAAGQPGEEPGYGSTPAFRPAERPRTPSTSYEANGTQQCYQLSTIAFYGPTVRSAMAALLRMRSHPAARPGYLMASERERRPRDLAL